MLTFSENIWKRWLNPTSNLNRFRLRDYQRVFDSCFTNVEMNVVAREPEAYAKARARIRPEFLSGNEAQDAVTLIQVFARGPKS